MLLVGCACTRASATDREAAATPPPAPAPAPASTSGPTGAPTLTLFGAPAGVARYTCPAILAGGSFHYFLASGDTRVAFVDGDDLRALVNRSPTGALPPSYAPADLVDLRDGAPHSATECESGRNCLRREAAAALHRMLDAMRPEGLHGVVQSAFRGFGTQCWVFASWARGARGGFCEATEQSALPGHSQHQLGTTVDLFTSDWTERGAKSGQGVFRNGFGCTDGGRWFDANAWRFGFVVPYPIDPDDRQDGSRCQARGDRPVPIDPKTGYKHEPWHLRFVGVDAAAQYHEAWKASLPGGPGEITLEQWLRAQRGLVGDTELPICDGCSCGACATLADDGAPSPCGAASLRLDGSGRVAAPASEPRLVDGRAATARDGSLIVEVAVDAPAHTPTQTPVTTADGPTYGMADSFAALAPYPDVPPHRYEDLPGAWRVGVEPVPAHGQRWPWRAALAKPELAATWNRANVVLPARAGAATVHLRIAVARGIETLRVTLLRDGAEHGTREVAVP